MGLCLQAEQLYMNRTRCGAEKYLPFCFVCMCVCMELIEGYVNLYLVCNEGCAASVHVHMCVCHGLYSLNCANVITVCVLTLQRVI